MVRLSSVDDSDGADWAKATLPVALASGETYVLRTGFEITSLEKAYAVSFGDVWGRPTVLLNGKALETAVGLFEGEFVNLPARYLRLGKNRLELVVNAEIPDGLLVRSRPLGLTPKLTFGVRGPITLRVDPLIHLDEAVARSNGRALIVTGFADNAAGSTESARLRLSVSQAGATIFDREFPISLRARSREPIRVEAIVPAALWSPELRSLYDCRIELISSAGVSQRNLQIGFRKFSETASHELAVNDSATAFFGASYFGFQPRSAARIERELRKLRATGANAIRIRESPTEALLQVCDKLGLFVYAEISTGESSPDALARQWSDVRESTLHLLRQCSNHPSLAAVGVDAGPAGRVQNIQTLLRKLRDEAAGFQIPLYTVARSPGNGYALDLAAIDLSGQVDGRSVSDAIREFARLHKSKRPTIFFATPTLNAQSDDELAQYEADQAISWGRLARDQGFDGVFLQSVSDCSLLLPSVLASDSYDGTLRTGVFGEGERRVERAMRTLISGEVPTSLASADTSDTPAAFLLYAFALALIVFLLMNVDRRFREYISRALLRPFNFFADVRDQRLIPTTHTVLLTLCISGTLALLFGGLVYAFRQSYNFQWLLTAVVPYATLHRVLAKAAWQSPLLLSIGTLAFFSLFVLLAVAVRFAAMFVRQRIFFGDAMNIVVWPALPFLLILPFAAILTRLDRDASLVWSAGVILGILAIWVLFRLFKALGVLFDVYPTKVYLYGSLTAVLLLVAFLFHMDYHYDFFDNWSYFRSRTAPDGSL